MRNYDLKIMGKKILIGGALLTSLLFGGKEAIANSNLAKKLEQEPAIEQTLEKKVSAPKISINFNYGTETSMGGVDYFTSRTSFNRDDGILDNPEFSDIEKVQDIMKDIKDEERESYITSYQELLDRSSNLSESQKLVLLSAIGTTLGSFNYDMKDLLSEVVSQDVFFYKLQNSLASGEENSLGVCRHIHSHVEQLANDLGIKAAAVTGAAEDGVGHVYAILKTKDGSAVIDYGNILIMNTKNIEKTLEAYQKDRGTTTFYHSFFEDNKFKYRLITKDGEHFLDFVEYDESSEPLKNALIQDFNPQPNLTVALDFEKYLSSFELNYKGLFVKAGEIRGGSSSPMNEMNLLQAGVKRKFLTSNTEHLNFLFGNKIIDFDGSFVCGKLHQDEIVDDNGVFGINGNLIVATNNEKGFNFSSRIAGNASQTNYFQNALFWDSVIGVGTSYKIKTKAGLDIEPYLVMQSTFFPKDIGSYKQRPRLAELSIGTVFDIKANNTKLSIEPYYLWKIWEHEIGMNGEFDIRNFGINIGGYVGKSNYDFCPDKKGYNIGLVGRHKKLEVKLNYKDEQTNYDGEKENQRSFDLGISKIF